jgi:ADP-heptose:LPS heptosyltransferase
MTRALVARLDNAGDLLLAGPAIRAIATRADVTLICRPSNIELASMLPGVSGIIPFDAPWIGYDAPPVTVAATERAVRALTAVRAQRAFVFTSFHQSPLPTAMLLRLAGVPWIAANCVDHPGSLLDLRRRPDASLHEVEQNLALAREAGDALATGDDGRLLLNTPVVAPPCAEPYVVVHPGASVPARALPLELACESACALAAQGWRVVVTGAPDECDVTAAVAAAVPSSGAMGLGAVDLGGQLSFARLASVIAGASALVCGNTGPGHIAAAVQTPVVCLFAPVVAMHQWRPWRVPSVVLGDQAVECAGCRHTTCPLDDQRCVSGVTAADVVAAVDSLAGARALGGAA